MHSAFRVARLAAFLAMVAAPYAWAAEVTTAQAKALETQMRGWLRSMLGPDTQPAGRTVQVKPEGDHYSIELPLGTPRATQPSPVTLSASAQQTEDGRWTFEGPILPSPTSFTLDVPAPTRQGQKAPGPNMPVEFTITTASGDSRGTFDPSFASPSTFSSSSRDVQIKARSAMLNQLTKIERSETASTLRPTGAGQVDYAGDATIEGYTVLSRSQDNLPFELSAQQIRVTSGITSLSRAQATMMLPAVVRLAKGVLAGPPVAGGDAVMAYPSIDPQLMRTILQSLQDLASEFTLSETLDGVAVRSENRNGAAGQVRIGMGIKSEGGLLQAYMDLGLDGLVLPDMAHGAMAELLPRKVALRPVLTGVPTAELIRWFGAMGDRTSSVSPPGFATLLLRDGVSTGLDSFAIDIGNTSFAGTGRLTAVSPDDVIVQAQITATNFDDVIARVNAVPELASVLPLFVFAKGVSRTVESRLVWNVAYRDNKLLVNGTDLSAMTGQPPGRGR